MNQTPAHRIDGFRAIIPAGGAGTRLWPLSRKGSPKFLHDLAGTGRTLIQGTYDRLAPLTGPDGVMIVTGVRHVDAVAAQLPELSDGSFLAEPTPRDSMAAIGLAAAIIALRDGPETVVGSFAADHVIDGEAEFCGAVERAVGAAREGYIVTIGIRPAFPSVAFGYIERGVAWGRGAGTPERPDLAAWTVAGFTEKPNQATAEKWFAGGNHWWNAGMFVAQAGVLLDQLARYKPRLAAGLRELAPAFGTAAWDDELERLWPTLEKIAIDYAIAEPVAAAGGLAVVEGTFSWDDVGDWKSLSELLPPKHVIDLPDDARVLGDPSLVRLLQSANALVVPGSGRLIALLGVDDLVVVDTDDALLITTRDQAQQVKSVVDGLAARGREDLL